MHSFKELSDLFTERFNQNILSTQPGTLYEAGNYFIQLGGKRVRPVICLMGNELFDEINPDTWEAAMAIELFHNFTLIHDDIMDKAALRRGKPTVHEKFGDSTALLAGDVLLVIAYDHLNRMNNTHLKKIIQLFNKTAREVCDGQQLDMEFENRDDVSMSEYLHMIEMKTSVLLASSLKMGAILGGASVGNQQHLYEFGKNLGIAFQIQDDYLDAFGDPQKFGKESGGDIKSNKKTFLLIHALESASASHQKALRKLMAENSDAKVKQVIEIFKASKVDEWASELKEQYFNEAMKHLEAAAVLSKRKEPLKELAKFLLMRDH
jgi:geranylgeranyl diphosphate synthase type II